MINEFQERLTELEIRFSHQAQMLDELNEVVTQCNLRIEQLNRENSRLHEIVKGLQPSMEESPDE